MLGTVKQEEKASEYDCICCKCELRIQIVGRYTLHRKIIIKRIFQKSYVTKSKWIEVAQDTAQELVL